VSINFEKAFGIHEQALVLRSQKSEVLASNIANANTPGFKARDFDFHKALKAATSQQTTSLERTNPSHFSGNSSGLPIELGYIKPFQTGTGDGNTVDLPSQQMAFAKNATEYQMSFRFLNGRIKGLLAAINGGNV